MKLLKKHVLTKKIYKEKTKYVSGYLPLSQAPQMTQSDEAKQKTCLGGHTLPHCFPSRTQALEAGQNLETQHTVAYISKNNTENHADIPVLN